MKYLLDAVGPSIKSFTLDIFPHRLSTDSLQPLLKCERLKGSAY